MTPSFLRFERQRPQTAPPGPVLGEIRHHGDAREQGLPRRLDGQTERVERWITTAAPEAGRTGLVTWRRAGPWLHAHARLTVRDGEQLRADTHALYTDLFEVLRQHGGLHLLKVWNYLPHINAELDGLEVYRHFNIGRQQAFLEAGQRAFEGAPAACALGHHGGPLSVHVLAGRVAPRPVENPRQVSAYHYPSAYGPRSPTFSRAALVALAPAEETLLISGTASIVGHETRHAGDVAAQTAETLRNLEAVIASAHAQTPARFDLRAMDLTVYLRDPADRPAVEAVLAAALGADAPGLRDALWLQADICRADLLVEIEAQGSAPR
ncbi:MAG: hypothetical protein RLZZ592_448 [Pseudomonadota bacterium]